MASDTVFVSTDWLAERLDAPDIVVVDGSWYLPVHARDPHADYAERRIPGAVRFDIDAVKDTGSDLPHMLPRPEAFAAAVGAMGIGDGGVQGQDRPEQPGRQLIPARGEVQHGQQEQAPGMGGFYAQQDGAQRLRLRHPALAVGAHGGTQQVDGGGRGHGAAAPLCRGGEGCRAGPALPSRFSVPMHEGRGGGGG